PEPLQSREEDVVAGPALERLHRGLLPPGVRKKDDRHLGPGALRLLQRAKPAKPAAPHAYQEEVAAPAGEPPGEVGGVLHDLQPRASDCRVGDGAESDELALRFGYGPARHGDPPPHRRRAPRLDTR